MLLKFSIVCITILSDILKMSTPSFTSTSVTIHDGKRGSKYYTFDNAKKKVKYSIFFPLEEAVRYEENYDEPFYDHDGPKWCGNCLTYGSCHGVFIAYCANCVGYCNFPGCACTVNAYTSDRTDWLPCHADECIFKTYLKNVNLSMVGDDEDNCYDEDNYYDYTNDSFGEDNRTIEDIENIEEKDLAQDYGFGHCDEDKEDEEYLKNLEKENLEKEVYIPMYARMALNKYRMVDDEAVLFHRYKTVEMQTSQENVNKKILEYEEQDRLDKEKHDRWSIKYNKLQDFNHEEEERNKSEKEHFKKYMDVFLKK